jgi:ABC-type enterochelin transport system permease subunit
MPKINITMQTNPITYHRFHEPTAAGTIQVASYITNIADMLMKPASGPWLHEIYSRILL